MPIFRGQPFKMTQEIGDRALVAQAAERAKTVKK
jgi:hypothetical protein